MRIVSTLIQSFCDLGESVRCSDDRHTTNHKVQHARYFRICRQSQRALHIIRGERFGGIPIHEWQVMVAGVLGMLVERSHDIPAFFSRNALQRRGKEKPNDR